jgi:hypothetical protein
MLAQNQRVRSIGRILGSPEVSTPNSIIIIGGAEEVNEK